MNTLGASFQRRPRAALLVVVPVLAALLGASLAWVLRDDGPDTATGPTTGVAGAPSAFVAGDLRLALPDGWKQVKNGTPVLAGFDKAHTTYLTSLSSNVAVTMLPPANANLLPAPLATGDQGVRQPGVVHAGRITAYHYVVAAQAQKTADVFTVPTTLGNATVACSTSVYELGECQQVVASLRLARGHFLKLSDQAAFLERLPAVVAQLNHDRPIVRARLAKAANPAQGQRAANRLGGVYTEAANALRPLLPEAGRARDTVKLLDRLRAEHASLALAIVDHDSIGFSRAAGTISSHEARLADELETWQKSLPQ
jgi:hypothetical protein